MNEKNNLNKINETSIVVESVLGVQP